MSDSIYRLIASRYAASPILRAALPGGLVAGRGRADAAKNGVRGTYNLVSLAPSWSTEPGFYHESPRVQFSVFGPSAEAVESAARELCGGPDGFDRIESDELDDAGIAAVQRVSGPVGPLLDDQEGPNGARVWQSTFDYLFSVSRSLE